MIISKAVPITVENYSDRLSYLYFSSKDERFLVFVIDLLDGTVLTVLPIEYWNNLRSKTRGERRIENLRGVSRENLLTSVKLVDPNHEILKCPPLRPTETLYLILIGSDVDGTKKLRSEPTTIEVFVEDSEYSKQLVISLFGEFIKSHEFLPTYAQLSQTTQSNWKDGWSMHEVDQDTEIDALTRLLIDEVQKKIEISNRYRCF